MTEWCYWMVHLPQLDISIKQDWTKWDEHDECRSESMKQSKLFDTWFMYKREITKFNNWKDVWLDFNRMKEIFPNVEILS